MIWHEYPADLTGIDVGSGGSKYTAWASIDGLIHVEVRIKLGTGFTMGSYPTVKLPVTQSPLFQGYQPCSGTVAYRQPATDRVSSGYILADNQSRDRVRFYQNVTGQLGNLHPTQPWTWQVGDSIYALFTIRTWGDPLPARSNPSTFAAVGDSITAWIDRNDVPVPSTWPNHANNTDLVLHGGWAKGGAKLAEMVTNTTAFGADVLVIMGGTNDLGTTWGTPIADRIARLSAIVQQSACPRVLISAIPPLDTNPAWSNEWNYHLQSQAQLHGWSFTDPWAPFRTPTGTYIPGASIDGIHPTEETSLAIANTLRNAILEVP